MNKEVAGSVDEQGRVRWSMTRVSEATRVHHNRIQGGMYVLTRAGVEALREIRGQ